MSSLRRILVHYGRWLILFAVAGVTFGLWFGVWLRVMQPIPRQVFHSAADLVPAAISHDNRRLVTKRREVWKDAFYGHGMSHDAIVHTGPIQLWDMTTGELFAEFLTKTDGLSSSSYDQAIKLSPDGRFLAVQHSDGMLSVWDIDGQAQCFSANVTDDKSWQPVGKAFSPDGRYLSFSSRLDRKLTVHVLNLLTKRLEQTLSDHHWPIAWSADSAKLACCSHEQENEVVHIVDLGSTKPVLTLRDLSQGVHQIGFDPGNRTLLLVLAMPSDGPPGRREARLHDLETGRLLSVLPVVWQAQFFTDGAKIVSECQHFQDERHCVKLWSSSPGTELACLRIRDFRDPSLAGGGTSIIVQHWTQEAPKGFFSSWLDSPGKSKSVAKVLLVNAATGHKIASISCEDWFVVSPDCHYLATRAPEGRIEIWDLPPRRPLILLLALAGLPTLLFTALLWWRLVR